MITDKSQFPTFDACFMPVLEVCNKWKISRKEMRDILYNKYYNNYSLEVYAWKSNDPLIFNRIHWAIHFLFAWKYLTRVSKWVYTTSEKGKNLLKSWKTLTYSYLIHEDEDYMKSSFHLWKWKWEDSTDVTVTVSQPDEITPEEALQNAYRLIEAPRKDELLERCREIDPIIFERIVWTLCEAMGYWTFIETQKSHDWWIDWIIKWDSLWFDKIYIQAKRYAEGNIVHEKEMQNFVWALASNWVKRWIFFTTSEFAPKAKKKAEDASKGWHNIILINWKMLADLMFQYNVWVQPKETYIIKDIDEDFFWDFN